MKITIVLNGCDDATFIPDVEVTEDQLELLQSIAKQSVERSEYGCMPTMRIDTTNKGNPW